jgi:hypothetical protein
MNSQTSTAQTADNPAWNELLGAVPSQLHGVIKPHLQKWDQGVQERFQKVHSDYEPWKPYAEAGISPDEVNYALNLLEAINTDPQRVYDALAQHLGIKGVPQNGSYPEQGESGTDEGGFEDPRLQELEEGYKNLAQITLAQHQKEQDAEADAELDKYLKTLTEKFGEYDERYVLAMIGAGVDGEEAVQSFQEMVNTAKTAQNRPPSPTVMSPGGGLPSQTVNPNLMNEKDRKALLASMLQAASQQNRTP